MLQHELQQKPITYEAFWEKIIRQAKEGCPEDFADLDYELANVYDCNGDTGHDLDQEPVKTDELTFSFSVQEGASEGYYADIYLFNFADRKKLHFGTLKTLGESRDAVKALSSAAADILFAATGYVYRHTEELRFHGYRVSFFRQESEDKYTEIGPTYSDSKAWDNPEKALKDRWDLLCARSQSAGITKGGKECRCLISDLARRTQIEFVLDGDEWKRAE